MSLPSTTAFRLPSFGRVEICSATWTLGLSFWLALKAETLHLAARTSEALEAIKEAEVLAERFEQRSSSADLPRLRGVFLAAMGGDETQIEASFCEAIRITKEQKSVPFEKRAIQTKHRRHAK